jgi:hypothetical protein
MPLLNSYQRIYLVFLKLFSNINRIKLKMNKYGKDKKSLNKLAHIMDFLLFLINCYLY